MKSNRLERLELWLIGLIVLAVNSAMTYLVVFRLGLFLTDAMARTRSAWQVFFSGEPKLANVGFVWAPMPTILQLPFVLIPAFRYKGLSANAVTVIMGAATAVVLALFLRSVTRGALPRLLRWLILATFVLNPMVLFYSANGMSEMTLTFFIVLALYGYWRWHETGEWIYLAAAGTSMGFAFLSRYDAAFTIVALAVVIAIEAVGRKPDNIQFSESTLLMFLVPAVYIAVMWVMANWIITGDPLYFARSEYSNAGQIGYQLSVETQLVPLKGNLAAAAQAGLAASWTLFPAFILISVAVFLLALVRWGWFWWGMLAAAWSLILFSIFNAYAGQSLQFLRYFFAAIPMAFVLGIGLMKLLERWRIPIAVLLIGLFALSGVSSIQAMRAAKDWGQWNDAFADALLSGKPVEAWRPEQELADYINKRTTGRIIVDDFQGYRIIFFSGHPERFITPADSYFKDALRDPQTYAAYVLASQGTLEGALNKVNIAYPDLYVNGANWVELEKETWVWKLFRVTGSPGQLPTAADQPASP